MQSIFVLFTIVSLFVTPITSFANDHENGTEFQQLAQTATKKKKSKINSKKRRTKKAKVEDVAVEPVDEAGASGASIYGIKGVLGMVTGDAVKDLDMVIGFGGDATYSMSGTKEGLNFKAGLIYWSASKELVSVSAMTLGAGAYYAYPLTATLILDPGVRLAYVSADTEVKGIVPGDFSARSASAIFLVIEPAINYYFGTNLYASAEMRYPIGLTTGDVEDGKLSSDFKVMYMMAGVGYRF